MAGQSIRDGIDMVVPVVAPSAGSAFLVYVVDALYGGTLAGMIWIVNVLTGGNL